MVERPEAGNEIRLKLSKIGLRKTIISCQYMPPKLTFWFNALLRLLPLFCQAQIELSDDSISLLGPAINSVADITKAAIRDQIQVENL